MSVAAAVGFLLDFTCLELKTQTRHRDSLGTLLTH